MNYLKERYRIIFTVLMIYLIFFIAFFLYSLPLYAIIYTVLLSLFLLSVIIFFDYLKLKKKHRQLKEKQLCQVNSQIENDYINIINQLKEEKQKLALNEQNKYQDMIDYYTTWVHQIKTPIASMKLTLDKEDGITARKLNKDLTAIESYVEMVLAYLRLDCSPNDLLIQEVKLDEAIRNAVKHFSSDFIHKKIRIEIINCEQRVLSDEKWLSFIIEQLLSNALKYTDKGKIVFSFKDNTLKISDSGIGINEKDLPRIFEKGYTGFNGRLNQKSSGLGLYLVKRSCDMLDHQIKIESKLNIGTDVYLSFNENKTKLD